MTGGNGETMSEFRVRKRTSDGSDIHHLVHANREYQILLFLRGDVTFHIDGRAYPMEEDDILLIGSGEVHSVEERRGEPYERISILFDDRYFEQFSNADCDLLSAFRERDGNGNREHRISHQTVHKYGLDQKIRRLYELENAKTPYTEVEQLSLLLDLLVSIARVCQENLEANSQVNAEGRRKGNITDVIKYISDNIGESFTLEELSERFYISKFYLCHEFKRVTGMSCMEYIRYLRILEAKNRLSRGWTVGEVWVSLGFGDYSTFYRTFKNRCGCSPNEYARQRLKQQAT